MRVLILGANGRSGQLTTTAALKAGHTVTAVVRNPSTMSPQPGLTTIKGMPLNQPDIEAAFASAPPKDPILAVISTLNAPRKSDSPFAAPVAPEMFVRDCVRNAMAVMRAHGVRTLVVMSAFGVGSSYPQLPLPVKFLMRHTNMRVSIDDHDALDKELMEGKGGSAELEWMLVRPAMLKEGGAGEAKEYGEEGKGMGYFAGITRASVAECLVECVEGKKGTRRVVVIAN